MPGRTILWLSFESHLGNEIMIKLYRWGALCRYLDASSGAAGEDNEQSSPQWYVFNDFRVTITSEEEVGAACVMVDP